MNDIEKRTYVTVVFPVEDPDGAKLDALMEALCAIDGLDPVISYHHEREARVSVAVPHWEVDDEVDE